MSLRHAILGFLTLKPMNGYELRKAFENSVGHFWPADQSQIYRTLAGLHLDGLTLAQSEPEGRILEKKTYHITSAGKAELEEWLARPQGEFVRREPILLRVFFAWLLDDQRTAAWLRAELDAARMRLSVFESMFAQCRDDAEGRRTPRFFALATLEQGILCTRAEVTWLESLHSRLRDGNFSQMDLLDPG